MNYIENIIEPKKLLLAWQSKIDTPEGRTRRFVAEIIRTNDNATLRYLIETKDFDEAVKHGFNGYPAFKKDCKVHDNVLDIFKQRIPQRTRPDFGTYLDSLRIKKATLVSDFALLGYSEAKLPEDGFSLLIPFEDQSPPFEFIAEVAGFRYSEGMQRISELVPGLRLLLEAEPKNEFDPMAIKILTEDTKINIGYINRMQTPAFHKWIQNNSIADPIIERINGTIQKPKVFMYIKVRP